MLQSHPCPRCNRPAPYCGEATADCDRVQVFQCDHCVRPFFFDGERFDAALTFAVDAAGTVLDPETLTPFDAAN
jgi:hypothetical protein